MGNFEKLVVVTVLFLCALVLAVSFRPGQEESPERGPLGPGRDALAANPGAERGDGLLDAAIRTEASGPASERSTPASKPPVQAPPPTAGPAIPGTILVSTEGLSEPTLAGAGFLLYAAVEGDRWSHLAQRFYGDPRRAQLLLQSNEEMANAHPIAGSTIVVPMYDTTRRPERAPTEPVRRGPLTAGELSAPRPGASTPATVPATRVADAAQSAVRTYTVKSGDTLSEISQELYGKSAKWRDIFEANKTKLASPDVLVVGMELVIP